MAPDDDDDDVVVDETKCLASSYFHSSLKFFTGKKYRVLNLAEAVLCQLIKRSRNSWLLSRWRRRLEYFFLMVVGVNRRRGHSRVVKMNTVKLICMTGEREREERGVLNED